MKSAYFHVKNNRKELKQVKVLFFVIKNSIAKYVLTTRGSDPDLGCNNLDGSGFNHYIDKDLDSDELKKKKIEKNVNHSEFEFEF